MGTNWENEIRRALVGTNRTPANPLLSDVISFVDGLYRQGILIRPENDFLRKGYLEFIELMWNLSILWDDIEHTDVEEPNEVLQKLPGF